MIDSEIAQLDIDLYRNLPREQYTIISARIIERVTLNTRAEIAILCVDLHDNANGRDERRAHIALVAGGACRIGLSIRANLCGRVASALQAIAQQ